MKPDSNRNYRCAIAPVAGAHRRPLWSVMIPAYNCAHYLKETLQSVLDQDPGEEQMEIWVVDDHSQDNPEEVVNTIGKGRVRFFRQHQNVGHTKNFETCLNLSRGRLIHLLHGDDRVKNGFYTRMQSLFEATPELGAAYCRHYFIDENGNTSRCSDLDQAHRGVLDNWRKRMAEIQMVQTPSIVVKRSMYEELGGFDSRLKYSEDWEMWVRIGARYPIGYEPEPLAEYRVHQLSITGRTARAGQNTRDLKRCIDMIYQHVDAAERDSVRKKALKFYAWHFFGLAHTLFFTYRNKAAAKQQLQEALRLYRSPAFLLASVRLYRRLLLS